MTATGLSGWLGQWTFKPWLASDEYEGDYGVICDEHEGDYGVICDKHEGDSLIFVTRMKVTMVSSVRSMTVTI
jgi:hypothetical protein